MTEWNPGPLSIATDVIHLVVWRLPFSHYWLPPHVVCLIPCTGGKYLCELELTCSLSRALGCNRRSHSPKDLASIGRDMIPDLDPIFSQESVVFTIINPLNPAAL
jgi:hypothetical protein